MTSTLRRRNQRQELADEFQHSFNISDSQLVNQTQTQSRAQSRAQTQAQIQTQAQVQAHPNDEDVVEAEPLEEWQPHRMHDTDFESEPDEFTTDPDFCFMCSVSQSKHDVAENQNLAGLIRYVDENFHLVRPKILVNDIQMYYNANLRPYLDEPKVWRKVTIFKHFDEHAPTDTIMQENTLRTYNDVMRVLRDNGLFLKDHFSSRLNVDKKALDMYVQVERQRTRILNRVTEKRSTNLL